MPNAALPGQAALYSLEAEEATLGCVLVNPSIYPAISFLKTESFYLHKHRWIWEALVCLIQTQSGVVDFITLSEELARRKHLEEVGGTSYLTQLINTVPGTSLHAEAYAKIVETDFLRRRLMESATAIATLAYREDQDIEQSIQDARACVRAVESGYSSKETLVPASGYVERVHQTLSDPEALKEYLRPTRLRPIDAMLGGGVEDKTLTLIAGRPGMGKSSLMLQLADLLSEAGERVAFFSKEMSTEQCVRRMILRRAKISWDRFKENKITDDEWARVVEIENSFYSRQTLWIDDSTPQDTEQVRRLVENKMDEWGGMEWVLGDHVRLFSDQGHNEVHRQGKISWGWKQIAKLGTRSILGLQLNRGVESQDNKRPDLKDLRDSGEHEENADTALFLFRPSYYAKDENDALFNDRTIEIWQRKGRESARNLMAKMVFIPEIMSFETLDPLSAVKSSVRQNGNGRHLEHV